MELAVQKDPKNAEGIANLLVLNSISGNNTDELVEYVFHYSLLQNTLLTGRRSLKQANPNHQLLLDLEEKSSLFDKAAAKYSAKA